MANDLDHIRWARLPETAPRPTRPFPNAPRPPLIEDTRQHGQVLKQLAEGTLQEVRQKREQLGIDPNNLLVLSFTFLNISQRETLEDRFGVQIVEEVEIKGEVDEPYYKVLVRLEDTDALTDLLGQASQLEGLVSTERVRASNGSADPVALDLHFDGRNRAISFIGDKDAHNELKLKLRSRQPVKISSSRQIQLLVQFPNANVLTQFQNELELYRTGSTAQGVLPPGLRRTLFDALEAVSRLSSEDRRGNRLREEGSLEKEGSSILMSIFGILV